MKHNLCSNIKEVLSECFSSDENLYTKWHIIAGAGLENCVSRTLEDFKKAKELFIFEIKDGLDLVGYFGKELFNNNVYLTGFFIKPSYRNRKDEVWSLIKKELGPNFNSGVYAVNKPACRFLEKMGGKCLLTGIFDGSLGMIFTFKEED